MTNKELQRILKQYPANAEVYLVKDWETCNEDGMLTNIAELDECNVGVQTQVVDMGLEFMDIPQVLIG